MAKPLCDQAITRKSALDTSKDAAPRETISIAFTRSQYATPCHDHTIPGSTPGHSLRRLGRRHQPTGILYDHLSHALVAHSSGDPWKGNADHPAPLGGNFVLHTKNGGKRHFDEPTGFFSERSWKPSKRACVPPDELARPHTASRRGRGVYNTSDGWIHPDAEEAWRRREEEALRQHARGRKAQVAQPPDHTLEELSMWIRTGRENDGGVAGPSSEPHAVPSSATTTAADGRTRRRHLRPHHKAGAPIISAAAPLTGLPPPKALADYHDSWTLPAIGPGMPSRHSNAAEAEALAQYHHDKRIRQMMQAERAAAAASRTRAADIQAVRELPHW
ncbi:hypothetical protein LSCM1_05900 [Leishmania martiniquensis]|uniref:Uncharacterized protein n=1 Tax=Leishmania martiniquensis TaxID=1580590 RepID=A0A836HTQ1_9TRYP|nr:hypothetical protein LSCM1_05900 [Leishmania martiniquensis]